MLRMMNSPTDERRPRTARGCINNVSSAKLAPTV